MQIKERVLCQKNILLSVKYVKGNGFKDWNSYNDYNDYIVAYYMVHNKHITPVMNLDPKGTSLITIMLISADASLLITYIADVIDNLKNNESGFNVMSSKKNLWGIVWNTVSGFVAPTIPFGSTMFGKFIEVKVIELFKIKKYSKEEKSNIY